MYKRQALDSALLSDSDSALELPDDVLDDADDELLVLWEEPVSYTHLGDLLIDLEHPALPVHLLDEQMQTAHQGAFVQNGLFILEAEQEVGRAVLGQESGVGDVYKRQGQCRSYRSPPA